ncbi:uncharacterized protein LOC123922865 [Trifolium pratense]|uniref:Uncharacterized protein n=1 Tax=Trifolium pratense TaxID=57577 RepID=A0ACB0KJC7_TRIPR|nr:uncharacterized protein LOC123922865 [Trifolium pratense]CAJ2656661.1 unnamed protein product [Trifolium pratense]
MENRCFTTSFFLFLVLLLPYCSRGESEPILHSEVYEIDYKGPETHSSVPPPHHNPRLFPRKSLVRSGKASGSLMGGTATRATNKVKKVHG